MAAGNNRLPKDADDGSTPIHEDEIELLIPGIRTRAELNAWEATNIAHANEWAFGRARLDILSVEILRELHRRMFDAVWKWAGEFRRTDNNISLHHWPDVPVLVRIFTETDATRGWRPSFSNASGIVRRSRGARRRKNQRLFVTGISRLCGRPTVGTTNSFTASFAAER